MKTNWKVIVVEILKVIVTLLSAGAGAYTAVHM